MSTGVINATSVNLRGPDNVVLTFLPEGTAVDIEVEDDSTSRLLVSATLGGAPRFGFVEKRYVTIDGAPAQPTTPAPLNIPVGSVVDLPDGYAQSFGARVFRNSTEIDQYFAQKTGTSFIDWFNRSFADKGPWANKKILGVNVDSHFQTFWDSYCQPSGATLMEFIAYMSIFINERGGDLVSISEEYGRQGHPGISYLFDSFEITDASGRTFRKASYNVKPNMSAGACFNDADFNAAHGALAKAAQLAHSQDPVWTGTVYPQQSMPTKADVGQIGYILEADFFKFRGRGLIQSTWRNNYADIVSSVLAYTGNNALVQTYQRKWQGVLPDKICTISTSADWDDLFEKTDNEIVCVAIRLHARAGGYLPLSLQTTKINGTGPGSLAFMAEEISGGGVTYAALFKRRVCQLALALGPS